jgi:putative FmdB family regulatory protein
MPIYEYQCGGCGETFEVLQKYDDPAPKKHDDCGSKKVKRVMSPTAFVFKGEGWYVTDYARKDQDKKNKAKKKKDSGSEGGGTTTGGDSGSSSSSSTSTSSGTSSGGGNKATAA